MTHQKGFEAYNSKIQTVSTDFLVIIYNQHGQAFVAL
jgi:hypothetical protein